MSYSTYAYAAIAICAVVTIIIRALPFAVFGSRSLPKTVEYLGKMLPGSIMVVLIIYCLKSVSVTAWPFGIPEFACVLLCAVLQYRLKNSIPSITIATVVYMVLTRTIFA
ncbi:MAG: AzlD domain-containing protein [Eubacteriales bacterium]|nr:AzlD domain-containing protein [Eubacteriales bacterium]